VYTKVVLHTKTKTLMPLIARKIAPASVVYTDGYRSDNALEMSDFYHERINHSKLYATGKNPINGIENFWNQAQRVLRKYNGIPKESFPLFLKECEFRFHYGSPKQQLLILKEWAGI
jgi:transposase